MYSPAPLTRAFVKSAAVAGEEGQKESECVRESARAQGGSSSLKYSSKLDSRATSQKKDRN